MTLTNSFERLRLKYFSRLNLARERVETFNRCPLRLTVHLRLQASTLIKYFPLLLHSSTPSRRSLACLLACLMYKQTFLEGSIFYESMSLFAEHVCRFELLFRGILSYVRRHVDLLLSQVSFDSIVFTSDHDLLVWNTIVGCNLLELIT